jgi:hypothetical protein
VPYCRAVKQKKSDRASQLPGHAYLRNKARVKGRKDAVVVAKQLTEQRAAEDIGVHTRPAVIDEWT